MEKEIYYSRDSRALVVTSIEELGSFSPIIYGNRFKYDYLLVIGNGFDLNLGLKTTYRDFVNSCIFKKMYEKRMEEKRTNSNSQPSLLDYLYGKQFDEKWYDIEEALLEYVSKKPDGTFVNNSKEDKKDYDDVCGSLIEYLSSLFKTGNDLEQSKKMKITPAGKLIEKLNFNRTERNVVYSFNYTPINLIIRAIACESRLDPVRVHGEIQEDVIFDGNVNDSAIILGFEISDINNIAPGYSFMLKSNNLAYKSTDIAFDLLNSRNVIFFGHSLNQMDFGYFEDYFKVLASNTEKQRKLIIFTKDEESRVVLLDNIRKMGISVRDIYTHASLDFIRTDYIDNEDSVDSVLFKKLLNKIEESSYQTTEL